MPNNSGTATIPFIGSGIFKGKLHPLQYPQQPPLLTWLHMEEKKEVHIKYWLQKYKDLKEEDI